MQSNIAKYNIGNYNTIIVCAKDPAKDLCHSRFDCPSCQIPHVRLALVTLDFSVVSAFGRVRLHSARTGNSKLTKENSVKYTWMVSVCSGLAQKNYVTGHKPDVTAMLKAWSTCVIQLLRRPVFVFLRITFVVGGTEYRSFLLTLLGSVWSWRVWHRCKYI